FLIDKGYNPDFGARPLRRALGTYIEDPLSEMLLAGEIGTDSIVSVTRKDDADNLFFEPKDRPADETASESGASEDDDKPVEAGAGST
ncbi:MAG: hypothetical protein AAFO89_09325, partial [Planctomycetota bacterium]